MKKYKYVIVSPPGSSGGIIALHALCHYLSEQGENAKMFYIDRGYYNKHSRMVWLYSFCYSLKEWLEIKLHKRPKTNMLGCSRKWSPIIGKDTVVVYPELICGNFLYSKNVVRWLLYHNKNYTQDGEKTIGYGKRDLFFCYREVFNDEKLNPEGRRLRVASLDLDTYKRYNFGERTGNCYIVRKGGHRTDLPAEFGGPVIDYLPEKEKVAYFNKCKYCISYDTQTTYSQIAAMCGCISVVVPEPGKTRRDYRPEGGVYNGVAFGFSDEEIEFAERTQGEVEKQFKKIIADSISDVKEFTKICSDYFESK